MRFIFASLTLWVLTGGVGLAQVAYCENAGDHAIVQVDISFKFENSQFNTETFLTSMEPRVTDFSLYQTHPQFPRASQINDGTMQARFCLTAGSLDPRSVVPLTREGIPKAIKFWYGPRFINFSVSQLRANLAYLIERGSRPDEARANVVVLSNPIELDPGADPDWLSVEEARLATLSDSSTVMRLKFYNNGDHRAPSVAAVMSATNVEGSRCVSFGSVVQATIELREANGKLIAETTSLDFGDKERRDAKLEEGPCGELDVEFSLGDIPAVPGKSELRVNYQFLEFDRDGVDSRPFWTIFKSGFLSFEGDHVWPNRIYVERPAE